MKKIIFFQFAFLCLHENGSNAAIVKPLLPFPVMILAYRLRNHNPAKKASAGKEVVHAAREFAEKWLAELKKKYKK